MKLKVLVFCDTDGKVRIGQSTGSANPVVVPEDTPLAFWRTLYGSLFSISLTELLS